MIERIKQHIKDHKVAYACGITAVASAGITYAIMRSGSISCGYSTSSGSLVDTRFPQITSHSFNKDITDSFNTTNYNFVKRLSYILRDPETDQWWKSQADLARELGVSPSAVSQYLNHARPIEGYPDLNIVREGVRSEN